MKLSIKKLRFKLENLIMRVLLKDVIKDLDQHSPPRGFQLERDFQRESNRAEENADIS